MNDSLQSADQHVDETLWPLPKPSFPDRSPCLEISVAAHLSAGKSVLKELAGLGERARKDWQFHREMKWIAENGHRFSGQWIALEGDCLLAEGRTSREVFSKVANRTQPPLVIRIEEEDLPFAGW